MKIFVVGFGTYVAFVTDNYNIAIEYRDKYNYESDVSLYKIMTIEKMAKLAYLGGYKDGSEWTLENGYSPDR